MIRFFLILIFLIFFFIITIPIVLIDLLIGCFNRHARDVIALKIVQTAFHIIIFLSGIRLDIQGKENIPRDTAVLYIGNHSGFFDVLIGYTLVPALTGFIAKKEFKRIPALNWWMLLVNCLFLDREDPREGMKTISKAIEYIKKGISIFVFPEGTRSKTGEVGEFKEGTFRIASKANCKIVPIAFSGTANAFEKQFPKIRPVPITVTICEPIDPSTLSREEKKNLGSMTRSVIVNALNEL